MIIGSRALLKSVGHESGLGVRVPLPPQRIVDDLIRKLVRRQFESAQLHDSSPVRLEETGVKILKFGADRN